ncbi:MAG: sulfatase [Phycisphaerae bacterium]|nr:sulfatase [Phycisphaerae bacterium]
MNRRDFLKECAAVGATGFVLSNRTLDVRMAEKHRNVLFIAIDDLNDWIGCLGGHPDAKTPNLDRLAQRGVLFTSAHCSAPACNPSRASLMTGIIPSTSGVYKNQDPWRDFLPHAVTLPQHFMANGYKAIGRGKIYHGAWPDTNPGAWDEYIAKGSDPPALKTHPRYMNPTGNIEWGPVDGTEEDMDDYRVATWTAEQLLKKHNKPFFLACGFYKPHLKWCAPEEYFEMFVPESVTLPNIDENDLDDVPPIGVNMAKPQTHEKITDADAWGDAVAAYLACGTFVDRQVGRVLDALDSGPNRDSTVIVLWSDHGWHLGEKLHWKKFALWEEATHNLLMFVAPGLTRAGSRCTRPVSLLDIYPTLIDVCGLSPNPKLQGKSLLPLLENPNAHRDHPALTTHGRNNHSVRSQRWRYIRYSDGTEELYDHNNDELEWKNLLWGDDPDPEHRRVADELAKWLPKVNY